MSLHQLMMAESRILVRMHFRMKKMLLMHY
jgi:hypothetical protein